MPLLTIPHITVGDREYAKVDALWRMLLFRIERHTALSQREKVFYTDKLSKAISSTRDNGQKLANLEALQAELDTVLA